MATWTQTLEPYIKVQERIKTVAQNPTAGESLIIGAVFISDAGPCTPTLITSQSEFLSTFASQDMSQDYIESLNKFYTGDDKTLASTMWKNAYRLAGSNTLLLTRAAKATDISYVKPLSAAGIDINKWIVRDGEIMKKVNSFKFVIGNETTHDGKGWLININGVGIFGNRINDDGPMYDLFADSLPELVNQLNETTKFFSPNYEFFYDVACEHNEPWSETVQEGETVKTVRHDDIVAVKFEEVYLGSFILDKEDPRTEIVVEGEKRNYGFLYIYPETPDSTSESQSIIEDLNADNWSGFTAANYYAVNANNSATNLKVRIRRFNHDAVVPKELSPVPSDVLPNGESPYTVLTSVLDAYTAGGTREVSEEVRARDFYEVAVVDPSINDKASFFNIGNITGRGDIEVSELNSLLKMIQVVLPDDLRDLDLNYYDYGEDDKEWVADPTRNAAEFKKEDPEHPGEYIFDPEKSRQNLSDLWKPGQPNEPTVGTAMWVISENSAYVFSNNGIHQAYADLTINTANTSILNVSDADLKRALDLIVADEVYTTEGLCDLGNTELSFQNYMANVAINDNYFYPISTVNSTNYMTVGNSATKLTQDSCKLYMSAPWDIDSATVGYKFYASPAVLYWEAVARNRRNNREFAPLFGQSTGSVGYARPAVEYNKVQRQLLLSRKVNTAMWNTNLNQWQMNTNVVHETEDNIMNDDGNSRLMIRISKAMPSLLRQFIGKRISEKLCADVVNVIKYWFKTVILPMEYSVDAYEVFCDYSDELARQNKIKVVVNVRYQRALRMIEVYNNAYDLGMDISNPDA